MVELMQRYTQLKGHTDPDDVGLALIVDAELFRLEAVVRWLDAADVRLQDSPKVEVAPRPKRPRLTRLLDTHR